ncbi:MAG: aldo/keto reductase [Gammaproteobacteria bacterium]|nr:aldo/keto reductase [Gammaproteobacteria bacterium]
MISRREWLRTTAGAGVALAASGWRFGDAGGVWGGNPGPGVQDMILKPIPSSGERIPVIGLGGRWISTRAGEEELAGHRAVLRALASGAEGGGRVFDTAPGYGGGGSEEYGGRWAEEDRFQEDIFWATKVNVAGRGGGSVDPADVRRQIDRSFERLRIPVIDLNQVHNMGDPPTQLGVLKEYKASGRIRYIGITTTSERQYPELVQVMEDYPIDFVGVDYAIDSRLAEEAVFPAALDQGVAVMVYLPFGRSRMWARIGDRRLPEWASEFDASTWAQFMLKFVVAHPAVTVAVPGTGDAEHMVDNLGGGRGRLPTAEHLRRMIDLVEDLPGA